MEGYSFNCIYFLVTLHGTFHSKIAKIKTSQMQYATKTLKLVAAINSVLKVVPVEWDNKHMLVSCGVGQ